MRQEMEQATKQQKVQAQNTGMEQEREQIEKFKLNKQQLTQNATGAADNNIILPMHRPEPIMHLELPIML